MNELHFKNIPHTIIAIPVSSINAGGVSELLRSIASLSEPFVAYFVPIIAGSSPTEGEHPTISGTQG
jgi:translation initiation factor IF-2